MEDDSLSDSDFANKARAIIKQWRKSMKKSTKKSPLKKKKKSRHTWTNEETATLVHAYQQYGESGSKWKDITKAMRQLNPDLKQAAVKSKWHAMQALLPKWTKVKISWDFLKVRSPPNSVPDEAKVSLNQLT